MKPTKEFFENLSKLNKAADLMMEAADGVRIPQVCFARAMRTILDPNSTKIIKGDNDNELIYNVMQMILEFIIFTPEITSEWVIQRNFCLPALTDSEKNEIDVFIKKVREENNVK